MGDEEVGNHFSVGFQLGFTIFPHFAGTAFQYLPERLVADDVKQLEDLFLAGCIMCNGREINADFICQVGDCLKINLPDHYEAEVDSEWR
ncbi:MAG: hypothetical protein OIF55_20150 [Amphritea sp.]|nr:hypothetical protein [Amphritea sp.]